jgi:nucleotide-binding universal stress UspA family protein
MDPGADRAVARAVRLAVVHDAPLTVVSVLDEDASDAQQAERKDRVTRFCKSLKDCDTIALNVVIATGDPVDEVHNAARKAEAEIVVLGLHKPRTILDSMRETTMERLVRTSPRPALLVQNPADHAYRSILAAVDFSHAAEAAVTEARRLAPEATVAMVHAVHVPYQSSVGAPGGVGEIPSMVDPAPFVKDAENRNKAWQARGPRLGDLQPTDILVGPISFVLKREVTARNPDLLALGAHNTKGAVDWLLGSIAADLIREPPCDLLVAPATVA